MPKHDSRIMDTQRAAKAQLRIRIHDNWRMLKDGWELLDPPPRVALSRIADGSPDPATRSAAAEALRTPDTVARRFVPRTGYAWEPVDGQTFRLRVRQNSYFYYLIFLCHLKVTRRS